MLKIRIAETKNFSEEVILQLKTFAEVDVVETEKSDLTTCLASYDVFWFRLKFKIEENDFPENTQCKFILCPVTGLDHIDLAACAKRNIQVISLKGETEFLSKVRATAELTLALTLALLRQVPKAVESVNTFTWNRDLFKGHEIFEKKVGIVGVGRLGKITAGFFKAFGATVYGYDIKPFDEDICIKVNSLEELAAQVDILSIHVAYHEDTHHLINEKIFSLMKPESILINTSRGGVVDSDDLLVALKENKLRGAALDVIENEYAIEKHPLIEYAKENPRLIITPHIGGNTWESFDKTEHFLADKLMAKLNTV